MEVKLNWEQIKDILVNAGIWVGDTPTHLITLCPYCSVEKGKPYKKFYIQKDNLLFHCFRCETSGKGWASIPNLLLPLLTNNPNINKEIEVKLGVSPTTLFRQIQKLIDQTNNNILNLNLLFATNTKQPQQMFSLTSIVQKLREFIDVVGSDYPQLHQLTPLLELLYNHLESLLNQYTNISAKLKSISTADTKTKIELLKYLIWNDGITTPILIYPYPTAEELTQLNNDYIKRLKQDVVKFIYTIYTTIGNKILEIGVNTNELTEIVLETISVVGRILSHTATKIPDLVDYLYEKQHNDNMVNVVQVKVELGVITPNLLQSIIKDKIIPELKSNQYLQFAKTDFINSVINYLGSIQFRQLGVST